MRMSGAKILMECLLEQGVNTVFGYPGATILNVAGGARTPEIVKGIRQKFPKVPIVASGGKTPESITATIEAGANAIVYTPPSSAALFRELMDSYRNQ